MEREQIPIIGEEGTDTHSGRPVWWDGSGWSYNKPETFSDSEHDRSHKPSERRQLPLMSGVRPPRIPLSFAQQRLWFLGQLTEDTAEYHMPQSLRLRGKLDPFALEYCINQIIQRHEILRTTFQQIEGDPFQVIASETTISIPVTDISRENQEKQNALVRAAVALESTAPFDLAKGPLIRMRLFQVSEDEHILLRTLHHIVSDGWSEAVFNRELMELYEAFAEGRENPLPPLKVQYADFAIWQRQWLAMGLLDEGLKYWKGRLEDFPEQLNLPADHARQSVQTHEAGIVRFTLNSADTAALRMVAEEHRSTLYMVLLAAFGVLLARYSGQDDLIVGSPIANRQELQLESMIGFFVNSLPMRMQVDSDLSFSAFLRNVRQSTLDAYQYQDVPFERLVEELAPQRILNRNPIFQVWFALQNAPWSSHELKSLDIEPIPLDERLHLRFDLEIHAKESGDGVSFSVLYDKSLFDHWRI